MLDLDKERIFLVLSPLLFSKKCRSSHNETKWNHFFVYFDILKLLFYYCLFWNLIYIFFLEWDCGNHFSIMLFEWDLSFFILSDIFYFFIFLLWMLRKLGKEMGKNLIKIGFSWVVLFKGMKQTILLCFLFSRLKIFVSLIRWCENDVGSLFGFREKWEIFLFLFISLFVW